MIEFLKAKDLDYKKCFELVEKRIAWMNEKSIKHWNTSNYLEVYPLDHYLKLQNNNELFVLKDNEEIVCFGALLNDDPRWNNKKTAYYIHHLTSKISSKHYGELFINKAIDHSLKNNRECLRLDSSLNYPKLEEYYSKFGFVECGECVDGEYHGILRQLDITDKKTLRKYMKSIKLDDRYIDEASLKIENILLSLDEYKNANKLYPMSRTVNKRRFRSN